MPETAVPLILVVLMVGAFWLGVYCWLLYRLGRAIANRYRTRPAIVFATITAISAFLALLGLLLPVEIIWKSVIVFSIWITHTQALASGFWAGMELGKRSDEIEFNRRTEEWLSEWERPVTKSTGDEAD